MSSNINWNLASQQFSEGFNSTFQQGRDLVQRESEFIRTQNFQDRQLRLFEGFRRDELAETARYHGMLGNYYEGQLEQAQQNAQIKMETNRIKIQKGESDLYIKGFQKVDETTPMADPNAPIIQAWEDWWVVPPKKQSQWVDGPQGTSVEQVSTTDPITGEKTITDYGGIIRPVKAKIDPKKDISNETGQVNKLLEIYKGFKKDDSKITVNLPNGETAEWDKTLWRGNAKQYTTDMLSKVGIDPEGDYLYQIKTSAQIPAYGKNQWDSFSDEQKKGIAENREKALLDEIYNRRYKGEINDQQYEALRYWAKVGSR
jgi:hypothetical protein